MKSSGIRQAYLDFFKSKGHSIMPSASLVPENDPSTLFTSSGMQPLVPYLMGEPHPEGKRLANSQKSFRCEDIEEVGDNRHLTFFEMLGNWSLGDYFKEEQLHWFFEFLTQAIKLDPRRLYVTVFRGNKEIGIDKDSESVRIWKNIFKKAGIDAEDVDWAEKKQFQGGRIFYYDETKNWWSRSGKPADMPVGEIGGPDSEVFYDLGVDLKHHENSQWRDEPCHVNCDCGRFVEVGNSVFMEFVRRKNGFEPLPQKNVDFGGGLERVVMAVQEKDNIFETDLFINIIKKLEELSGVKYRENMKSFGVIADHLRAATFVMGDDKGVSPSNVDQGYIVRRLVRRAIRYGRQLGIQQDMWTKEVAKIVAEDCATVYPELKRNLDFVVANLEEEEEKFGKTLERGLKELENNIRSFQVFNEAAKKEYKKELPFKGGFSFYMYETHGFPPEMTLEELKKYPEISSKINEKEYREHFNKRLREHQELSRTASAGKFKGGLADVSEETKKLHTACHLLLAALRKVLGNHVEQRGSNITAERLRFDFSHPDKLTKEQKEEVEKLVNEAIQKNLKVACEEMPLEKAKEEEAVGVFESKYGEKVKVYTIRNKDYVFSKEICGGPHVESVGVLGHFKIIKEESSSAGVRRIKAILE